MAYSKKNHPFRVFLATLLAVFFLSGTVWAEGSAAPGRSVGHVFLGMDRADVWKILHKPGHSATVPHGMSLYGEDIWISPDDLTLTVISERDKVTQIEFDSPRFITTDGLNNDTPLAQVRRRHPVMTVQGYDLRSAPGYEDYEAVEGKVYHSRFPGYYLDDVPHGLAFVFMPEAVVVPNDLGDLPSAVIVHRPGYPAVPIYDGRWSSRMPTNEDPESLHVIRAWFTPNKGPHRSRGART